MPQIPKVRTAVKRFLFYGAIALVIEHNLDTIIPWVAQQVEAVKAMAGS